MTDHIMQIPSDPWDPRAALSAKTGGGASSPSCSCDISQCFETSPTCIRTRYGHTAASLAIGSSADVKVVQQVLGYKSATMTSTSTATYSVTASTSWPTG